MNYKKTLVICVSLLQLVNLSIRAQKSTKEDKQDFPVSFSVVSHSWAFPFNNVFRFNPCYPGIATNTEYYYLKREKSKLFQTAEIGGFLNKESGSAIYFNSDFGYRYTAKFGLSSDISMGIGYFHGFHPRDIYKQDPEGDYSRIKDKGIASLSGNFSLGLGYDLSKVSNLKMMPFIRYQWLASTYYWSLIGIRPNGLLHLGIQVSIF